MGRSHETCWTYRHENVFEGVCFQNAKVIGYQREEYLPGNRVNMLVWRDLPTSMPSSRSGPDPAPTDKGVKRGMSPSELERLMGPPTADVREAYEAGGHEYSGVFINGKLIEFQLLAPPAPVPAP